MSIFTITLNDPTIDDLVEVYECYRQDGEPDSPQIPFTDLSDDERRAWVDGLRGMIRMIGGNDRTVGWISLKPEKGQYNLGFALFPRFRGQGLMSFGLPLIMDRLVFEISPPRFTAAVRSGNTPAIHVLQKAGFYYAGSIVKFDAVYENYEYPHLQSRGLRDDAKNL